MSNYPSQDQPSWSGRPSRGEQPGRTHRDTHREQDAGANQRRQWQQADEGSYGDASPTAPYGQRDFYEQNPMTSNYGAQRGGRAPHRNEPWPQNEDRENYSAAGDYGRQDYHEDSSQPSAGRYQSAGARRDYSQGLSQGALQGAHEYQAGRYNQPYREYGQSHGGPGANYAQMQDPAPWHDHRSQLQAFRGYQRDAFSQNGSFSQGDYGVPPQFGAQRNVPQPGYFQAGDFSQRGGYTRSEYPQDNDYLYSHPHSPDNQQAGRALGTQDWQEREGAQRGAFGLQNSHRGRGPQGYTRSDERIKEDICERLSEHHYIDASQIRVEVSQGVVTLEGSVDDRWQKYQTEDLADATSGVKDIQNHLNVSRAPRQSTQWTSQSAAPQTASSQQSAADTGASKQPLGNKIADTTRGKPGTAPN